MYLSAWILARCTTVSGVFSAVKLAEHQKGDYVNRQNKAKGRISKRVLQENKVLQIFRETNIIYPPDCTRTYQGTVAQWCNHHQGLINVRFLKI